jgi:hypothetical protein
MRVVFPEPDLPVIIIIFISTFKFLLKAIAYCRKISIVILYITFKKDFTIKA